MKPKNQKSVLLMVTLIVCIFSIALVLSVFSTLAATAIVVAIGGAALMICATLLSVTSAIIQFLASHFRAAYFRKE